MPKLKLVLILIALSLIILSGLKYRFRSYESLPPVSESFDEEVLVWVGSSLINNQIPVGWSFIDDYISKDEGHLIGLEDWAITQDGQKPTLASFSTFPKPLSRKIEMSIDGYTTHFTMVQPHIEQPPLGPLLASFLSGSYKLPNFDQVSLKQMRPPVILLFAISAVLVFIIAYLSFGVSVGLLSVLIYALTPTIVVTSRLVTSENYLTPFLLLGVMFTQLWIKLNKDRYLLLASLLITIAYLIKPFGLALAGVVFLAILAFKKDKKYLLYPVIFSVLGIALFFSYGYFYAPDLFPKIVAYQTGRLFSPLGGIYKIIIPKITKIFLDGWIIFGWLGVGALAVNNNLKRNFYVLTPIFCYLVMFVLYGGQDYGWYRLPIYPFLSIAAAVLLWEGIKNSNLWISSAFLVTAFATSLYWANFGLIWNNWALPFRLVVLTTFLLLSLGLLNSKGKIISLFIFTCLIAATLWLSIQTINNMTIIWPTLGDRI